MRNYPTLTKSRMKVCFNEIDSELNFILGKVNQPQAIEPIEEHIHPDSFEIVYIVKGEQVYHVCDTNYTVKSGECFITLPNELHSSGGYPEDKSILYYLILPQSMLYSLGFNTCECKQLLSNFMLAPNRVFTGDPYIIKLLEQLLRLPTSTLPLQKTRILSLLTQYLLLIVDCMATKEISSSKTLDSVLNYINEHIYESISIRDLCLLTNLSESHFKNHFRNIVGIPPAEYILRQKIQVSKKLLIHSSQSITEIAFSLSFSSSQYFATVFKRFTTLTPLEYRQNHQPKKVP